MATTEYPMMVSEYTDVYSKTFLHFFIEITIYTVLYVLFYSATRISLDYLNVRKMLEDSTNWLLTLTQNCFFQEEHSVIQ